MYCWVLSFSFSKKFIAKEEVEALKKSRELIGFQKCADQIFYALANSLLDKELLQAQRLSIGLKLH